MGLLHGKARAKVLRNTCFAPARTSGRAASIAVDPVVSTSSTSRTRAPVRGARASARTVNARLTLALRSAGCNPTWVAPSWRRSRASIKGISTRWARVSESKRSCVVSARARSAACGGYRRNQVPPGRQLPGDGGTGHALAHEPRQTAPAVILQAMHERVRRRPQNDCETRGRKLGAPFRTFEASVGGNST